MRNFMADIARKQRSAASIGLRTFRGPSANAGCAVRRIERVYSEGFDSFLFGLVLLAFGGFTAKLAAAEGEQDGNDEPMIICSLIYGELYLGGAWELITHITARQRTAAIFFGKQKE